MKIAIVSGSHRAQGNSLKVAALCKKQLEEKKNTAEIIDLSEGKLPLWDESFWAKDTKWNATWGPISKTLTDSDGLIVISPEYGGMVPAALKNFFLFLTGNIVAHKPGLLISVSAGPGGTYPIAELRASSYKNSRIVYLPDHVIVSKVETALNEEYIPKRISYSIDLLLQYSTALKSVRESGLINLKDYANGM